MPVVTLAEAESQMWLVGGEEHLSDLLLNALSPDIDVEMIACGSMAEVYALWQQRSPAAAEGGMPWTINPQIAARIRRSHGDGAREVIFTPWSAMLDATAQMELTVAAAWLAANPGGQLTLRQFAPTEPEHGLADLQKLRFQLAAGALQRAGVDPGRIDEGIAAAGNEADVNRLEIVTALP